MSNESKTKEKQGIPMKDFEIIAGLLPRHYECTQLENGVECKSAIGISEANNDEEWERFKFAVEQMFGKRLMEFYHVTCTYHLNFTVYLKEQENE